MAIAEGYKKNFQQLLLAARNQDLALVEVADEATQRPAVIITEIYFDGTHYNFVPMARMFDGNPCEELEPPAPEPVQYPR
jgi:stress response protein SCP2